MARHFLELDDFSKDELLDLLGLIRLLKDADRRGVTPRMLGGMSLGMLFESSSLRTRVSFETAMMELGGHGVYLKPGEIHLGVRETIYDTVQVLARMCDGIMARTDALETMQEIARCSSVPVINGMTVYSHPTQGLCDVFTMMENLPAEKLLSDMKVAFVSDASPVGCICTSLRQILPILGAHLAVAAPEEYQVEPDEAEKTKAACKASGATFSMTTDPIEAVREADFIVTDVWWYHGYDDEKEKRLNVFMPWYQINRELLNQAPKHCKVLHCMPANRGYEITSEVISVKRAVRAFSDEPLPEPSIIHILNAGRRAQSSKNTQPWQFIAITDKTILKLLSETGYSASHLSGAALGVAIVHPNPREKFQVMFDIGQSAAYMQLAAWELGIGSCLASIYQPDQARNLLGFPRDYFLNIAISFGYPLDTSILVRQSRIGGRKPLSEIIHWNR